MIYVVYYQRFFGLLRPGEIQRQTLNFSHRRVKTLAAASLVLPDDVVEELTRVTEQLKEKLGPNADPWQGDSRIR